MVALSPVRAEDCWSQVAETADPDLTVTVSSTEILTVRELLARGQKLTPPMMIMKALAGIDHFMRNPQCLTVYTDSLVLLDAYVAYRSTDKEEEWRNRTNFSFADSALAELTRVRRLSEDVIATGGVEKLPELIQQVHRGEGTWFRPVINLFDRNDLSRISVPCNALQDSALWRSAIVTRTEGIYDVPVLQVSYCNFSSLGLLQVQKYYDMATRSFNQVSESHIHQTVTDPDFFADADWLTREPLWAYFSAWNWTRWQNVRQLAGAAKKELSQLYQSRIGISELQADRLAENALGALLSVGKSLPIPEHDVRVVILRGGSMAEVAAAYSTRIPDGFDDESYRYLRERGYLFRDECSSSSYITTCKLDLFYDAYYRWEEHLALIGTPDPPLLIGVLRPDVVAWLLDAGEDIQQSNQIGKTTLMAAAHLNQLVTVKLLVGRGANVNQRSHGEIEAERKLDHPSYSWELTSYLLDTVLKPRSLRHAGRTALMYAAENADAEIIDLLLSAGADPCLADSKGLVPVDYFDGRAPSGQTNVKVTDATTRTRLLAALACPEDKRVLPAPFVPPTSATP